MYQMLNTKIERSNINPIVHRGITGLVIVIVNNSININKTNNHLSSQIIEHKQDLANTINYYLHLLNILFLMPSINQNHYIIKDKIIR
jgi:hypothetical protein